MDSTGAQLPWIRMEVTAYWVVFVTAFLAVAIWESLRPKSTLSIPAEGRWAAHALLLGVGAVLQSLVLRATPLVVAASAAENPWGILNRPGTPLAAQFLGAILLLDLVRYFTHRLFHSVSILWRMHEVHHSDPDYDVSTAARFHPLEIIVAKAIYVGSILILAPPVMAVFFAGLHTALLNLFVHANASLPSSVERLLRGAIITPDLHRLHHSEEILKQNRNFGQTFVWWDRLFGTYLPAGPGPWRTGVKDVSPERAMILKFMLAEPFWMRKK